MKKYLIAAIAAVTILTGCKQPTQMGGEITPSLHVQPIPEAPKSTVITIKPNSGVKLGIEDEITWDNISDGTKGPGIYKISEALCYLENNKEIYIHLSKENITSNSNLFTNYEIKLEKTEDGTISSKLIQPEKNLKIYTKSGFEGFFKGDKNSLAEFCSNHTSDEDSIDLAESESFVIVRCTKAFTIPTTETETKIDMSEDLSNWLSENFDRLASEDPEISNQALVDFETKLKCDTPVARTAKSSESSFTCEVYRPNNK